MNFKAGLGCLVLSLALFGCSKPYELENADAGAVAGEVGMVDSTGLYGANPYQSAGAFGINSNYVGNSGLGDFYQDPMYGVNVIGGPSGTERDRVVYFAFDSSNIDSRSENVIREHANYLRGHPQTMVVLEGHTDERGTREYNIGLGERRAYSVKSYLQAAGVNPQQMRVLSYGEERPAVWGTDELSYAKNRRVVIIY